MIRRPPRSTPLYSSAASDVYKRQLSLSLSLSLSLPLALSLSVARTHTPRRRHQPVRTCHRCSASMPVVPDGFGRRWGGECGPAASVCALICLSPLLQAQLTRRDARPSLSHDAHPENPAKVTQDPTCRCQPCHIVSCLLYTSPSPRDRQKSRMPSSA